MTQFESSSESTDEDRVPAASAGPCCATTTLTKCCEPSEKPGCCGTVADGEPAPTQCGCRP